MLQLSTIRTHQNLLRLQSPMCSLWSGPSINCCSNPRDVPPKCAHCSQNHPANYKGCSIYKELQRQKISSTLSKRIHTNFNTQTTNVQSSHSPDCTFPNQPNPQTQTYAQATSNASTNDAQSPTTDTQLPDLNKLMTNFLDKFKNVINPLISLLTKVISKLLDK